MFTDIFNDDAFSLVALTAAINEMDHIPGRAGELCFAGAGQGVPGYTVAIERKGDTFALISTSVRGAPAPTEGRPAKATLRSVDIPQIKLEDTVQAASVQGVREFGSTDASRAVASVVSGAMRKLVGRHDLTLEYHRLGALKGQILDADGVTVLTDLFDLFGVENDNSAYGGSSTDKAPKIFNFELDMVETDSDFVDIRVKCQELYRFVTRRAKMAVPSGALVWVLCGDNFFDKLISRGDVKEIWKNTDEQARRLGDNFAHGVFSVAGVAFENYRGTDDNSTVAIDPDEAIAFLVNVPGLYAEYFAPADFLETVNTIGLPRYAKVAPDQKYNRFVELHTQQNPLPLCLRPQTLLKLISE